MVVFIRYLHHTQAIHTHTRKMRLLLQSLIQTSRSTIIGCVASVLPALSTSPFKYILIVSLMYTMLIDKHKLADARFKRCFTCRSRGVLGDCRDPFTLNSTTFDGQVNAAHASIEATPCASGWCAKIIEDDFGDSIAATERSCMTRPPTDNEERCSETIFENHRDRKVFLCMCYGDLCNAATSVISHKLAATMTASIAALLCAMTLLGLQMASSPSATNRAYQHR